MNDRPHLLIVDDDREIRDLVSRLLQKHGYKVETARDAVAMEAILAVTRVDLVILDVMLPGRSGLDICRDLRARSPVSILMLTAVGDETDRIVGLEMGADDYLAKPFNPARASRPHPRDPAPRHRRGQHRPAPVHRGAAELRRVAPRSRPSPAGGAGWRHRRSYDRRIRLLVAFAERPQRVLTRNQLLDLARGRDAAPVRSQHRRPGEPHPPQDRG